ncbi:MAG: NAD-dependent malic enzyme [Pseudomonadota bacterium]|nr:NAD-dependent malic enzyme [Pseudomonadota bacterium]
MKRHRRTDNRRQVLESPLTGNALLENPILNKGTAFSERERIELGLLGLLPPHVETLEVQAERAWEAYLQENSDLERYIYLRNLQDTNETLFYRLIHDHLAQMMPIIYTPVVGEACQQFSEIFRRPRGLFISWPERRRIDVILDNAMVQDVRVIVVTDGERILGLGDQGAGGMGIPIGKLSLYTACGGIDPGTTLPVLLDVGTNNPERLEDPLYVGWRHRRIPNKDYDEFLDRFVQAVRRKWPDVLLQFEDFAQTHAGPLLDRYRDQLCTFNDDIQGTAAVAVGTLLAASKVAGVRLRDQNVVFLGAGSAGCGIAGQLIRTMVREGASKAEARSRLFLVDRSGLLHDGLVDLPPFQRDLAQSRERVGDWADNPAEGIGLMDVVRHARPSILIGVSGQPGLFTEAIIREMAGNVERPMIFPLSNPTSRIEAMPADLIRWTDGRALVATGSPFEPVSWNGRRYPIAQCNNSYIFPGMGLGIFAVKAGRVSDEMFMAAATALGESSPALSDPQASLLPPLREVRKVCQKIAFAVAREAQSQGLGESTSAKVLRQRIADSFWIPGYLPMRRKSP